MALVRCTDCNTIEGKWRLPNRHERKELMLEPNDEADEDVCVECGGVGTKANTPEHDEIDQGATV